ncbi:UvrB/uvrC motif [Seminavis robusta]|uniref:UvrB/uvrC motif n=1 Tax=Seminavis robusta TaxID=568900 RepID=A0A9N8EZ23_9STRA|nr:UvrB/uvrC motif [Seminavis robusta]|eukprot:Sro2034_g312000.1 UvrB/uvrC motif (292) ;mRNA; f:10947-11822
MATQVLMKVDTNGVVSTTSKLQASPRDTKPTNAATKVHTMKKQAVRNQDDGATDQAHAAMTPSNSKRMRARQSRIPAEDFKAILQANGLFYSAFSSLDMAAMENVWLKDKRCVCQFPEMKKLGGYDKIMRSWKHAVNQMDGAMRRNWMEPREIQVEFQSTDKAVLFCQELVYSISCSVVDGELRPESQLIQRLSATNAFKRINGRWHIWYHQATSMGDSTVKLKRPANQKDLTESLGRGASLQQSAVASELTTNSFEDKYGAIVKTHTSDTCQKESNCERLLKTLRLPGEE